MRQASNSQRWTYSSSQRLGIMKRAQDLWRLWRFTKQQDLVGRTLHNLHELENRVQASTGQPVTGMRVLDIGPGQKLSLLRAMSLRNDVTAIDMDIIPQGIDPMAYLHMVRDNSTTRVMKTLARKALGVDRNFRRDLAKSLGVRGFGRLPVLRMDATRTSFDDEYFDLVYSISVFEHIPDPGAALAEVARILRPGGVAYISIHLYTSHSGSHDPSIEYQEPYWPHLRAATRSHIAPSAYLNKVSLQDWYALLDQYLPGTLRILEQQTGLVEASKQLRESGELAEYSDADLRTVNLVAVWRKDFSCAKQDNTQVVEVP